MLWVTKSRQRTGKKGKAGFGTRLVEHLNIAAIAGMPVAMAAFFWANRLLPVAMAQRVEWEIHVVFFARGLCLLHPPLRPGRRAWVEQLVTGALLFAALPMLNAMVTERHLVASWAHGDWGRFWFDLRLLASAVLLGGIALKVGRRKAAPPVRKADVRRAAVPEAAQARPDHPQPNFRLYGLHGSLPGDGAASRAGFPQLSHSCMAQGPAPVIPSNAINGISKLAPWACGPRPPEPHQAAMDHPSGT